MGQIMVLFRNKVDNLVTKHLVYYKVLNPLKSLNFPFLFWGVQDVFTWKLQP